MALSTLELTAYATAGTGCIVTPNASDNSIRLIKITAGKMNIEIGACRFEAKEGDVLYVPPRMTFCAMCEEESGMRTVRFDARLLSDMMDNFEANLLSMFYIQSRIHLVAFTPEHSVHKLLSEIIDDACEEFFSKDVCYRLSMRSAVCRGMTALLRYYCGSTDESEVQIYHNVMRLLPAIDYIDAHCEDRIYVEDLARMIHITTDHFTKIFRDAMGTTPIDYVNTVRVNRAMRLLSETDKSVTDVALSCGFANSNYFHRIFKAYMDDAPFSYRKRCRQD